MIEAQLFVSLLVLLVLLHLFLGGVAYAILLERKIAAWSQDRVGPNRVGPLGLLQPIVDGIKNFMKEDFNPRGVDRALFFAAPALAVMPALIGWAVIPWGGTMQFSGFVLFTIPETLAGLALPASLVGMDIGVKAGYVTVAVANLNVGVLYILAVGSLAVYGVVIGGWASNNKYSFLGGLRATAQMLSYEIPMGLIVLVILLMAGAAHAEQINNPQVSYWFGFIPQWNILLQPIAAVIFFTCLLAEANRAPFDLAEAEQELVGGYHTEYSSMKFALFFLGEYLHMITASAFFVLLFLGGWHLPWIDLFYNSITGQGWTAQSIESGVLGVLLKVAVFIGKVVFMLALMMWVRWTLPRFRFDQLMGLAWRGLIPLSLALLLMTGVFVYFDIVDWLWLGNVVLAAAVLVLLPMLPAGPPVNRRVPLRGSRFSPPADEAPAL